MLPGIWEVVEGAESFTAESLDTEGFIHCSFIGQLKGVLERYYSAAESVVILEIDPEKLTSELKLEKSTDDELYPHVYGSINMDSVVSVSVRHLDPIVDINSGLSN